MIGSPAIVLGICRYDDDDEFWEKFQLFTGEDFLQSEDAGLKKYAMSRTKYHQTSVHFDSIGKDLEIKQSTHEFNLAEAKPLELTKPELALVQKELSEDGWDAFDWETWGK